MSVNLISIFAGLFILAILIFIILFTIVKSSGSKKKAKEFLMGLYDNLLNLMVDTIAGFDPKNYSSVEEFEATILYTIYDRSWDYVSHELESGFENNEIIKAVFKRIDKDFLIQFIDKIIEEAGISDKIKNKFGCVAISSGEIEKADQEAAEHFADESQYVENSDDVELNPAEPIVPSEEELAALNPQKDDEEEFNPEDESMEVLDDKPEIISVQDKRGRTLYYEVDSSGKKKQVSKAYAESMK